MQDMIVVEDLAGVISANKQINKQTNKQTLNYGNYVDYKGNGLTDSMNELPEA